MLLLLHVHSLLSFPEVTTLRNLVQNLLFQGMFLYYFYKQISIKMHDFLHVFKLYVMVTYIYIHVCHSEICSSSQLCFWDLSTGSCTVSQCVSKPQLTIHLMLDSQLVPDFSANTNTWCPSPLYKHYNVSRV